jgi:acetolactate synthase-1/2/3 large subunit
MGFAFPASLGAKLANPTARVFCVCGEGGFQMNMQELATCKENEIGVKIIILNNRSLGMVRQFQDSFYGGIRSGVDLGNVPDFVKLAEAYSIPAFTTNKAEEVPEILDKALDIQGPVILNFDIDPEANVYPIVPLGKGMLDFVEAS